MTIEHGNLTPASHPSATRGNHTVLSFADTLDETTRAAIVQVATDKGRWVDQTAGDYPGYYIADGTGLWLGPFPISGRSLEGPELILDPGAGAALGNLYETYDDAILAALAIGGPVRIRFMADVTVNTSTAYGDISDISFYAPIDAVAGQPKLTYQGTISHETPPRMIDGVDVDCDSTSAAGIFNTNGANILTVKDCTIEVLTGRNPLVAIVTVADALLLVNIGATYIVDNTEAFFTTVAAVYLVVNLDSPVQPTALTTDMFSDNAVGTSTLDIIEHDGHNVDTSLTQPSWSAGINYEVRGDVQTFFETVIAATTLRRANITTRFTQAAGGPGFTITIDLTDVTLQEGNFWEFIDTEGTSDENPITVLFTNSGLSGVINGVTEKSTAATSFVMAKNWGRWRVEVADGFFRLLPPSTAHNRIEPTDATVTTIHTATLPNNGDVLDLEATITAFDNTAVDMAKYRVHVGAYRDAGTVVAQAVIDTDFEDDASWAVTVDVSGNDVRIRIQGDATNNTLWRSVVREIFSIA